MQLRATTLTFLCSAILACAFSSSRSLIPAGQASDYYASVQSTTPAELRRSLHELIDDHKRIPYTSSATDTWNVLESADQDPADQGNILDLYKNASYAKVGGGNSSYNREHSWPKSYGFPDNSPSNYPYTDCHHLFLCNSKYNSSRSNKAYDSCDANSTRKATETNQGRGGQSTAYPGDSNWTKTGAWETWSGRRGDVARALFYLDVRYEGGKHADGSKEPDLILTNNRAFIQASQTGNNERVAYMGVLSVLLKWHCADPVDALERQRNEAIYQAQGNRNPFIDHPEWVHVLWGSQCPNGPVNPVDPNPQPGGDFWISEVHYDNTSSDQGEFVEVAGPAGAKLDGMRLLFYNGANGQVYREKRLSGTLPGNAGSGALAIGVSGIQNGNPDGVALLSTDGAVLEFLSYEGRFKASGGAARGLQSTDIGVKEDATTAVGHSLKRSSQLATWTGPSPATRGRL